MCFLLDLVTVCHLMSSTLSILFHFFWVAKLTSSPSPGSEDFGWIRCRASFGQQDPMPGTGTGARDGTGGATIGDWCSNWVRWNMFKLNCSETMCTVI